MSAPTRAGSRTIHNNPCHAAAHQYVQEGKLVIPVWWITDAGHCACKAGPKCKSPGKHPIPFEWQKRGARSGADVEEYWTQYPRANVGILTGNKSRCFVLDVDPDNGGFETYAKMVATFGEMVTTRRTQTGSGGYHDYFTNPPDFNVTNAKKKLEAIGLGLDIRGNGGMVVAPPSVSGKGAYLTIRDVAEAAANDWFLELLRPALLPPIPSGPPVSSEIADKYAARALEGELRLVRESTKGGQNDQLNKSAFKLGTLCAVGALDQQMVRTELIRASIASGYPARDGENAMIKTAGTRHRARHG